MNKLSIEMIPGDVAPRYPEGTELSCEKVVITEQGTESKLPIVDFVMVAPDGKKYLLVLTGRLINGIAAAVQGSNLRNHGVREP